MRIIALASILLLSSCQEVQRSPGSMAMGNTNVANFDDPRYLELQRYVNRFYTRMGNAGFNKTPRNLKFVFDYNMVKKYAGVCQYPFNGQPGIISINMDYWAYYSAEEKEILIHHEMGHCVLMRDHDNVNLSDGRPRSLMNSILISSNHYANHRTTYLSELFANARIPRGGGGGGGSSQATSSQFTVIDNYESREIDGDKIECDMDH